MCRFSTATFDAFSTLGFIDLDRYAKPLNWGKVSQSISVNDLPLRRGAQSCAGRMVSLAVVLNTSLCPSSTGLSCQLPGRTCDTLACGQQQQKKGGGGEGGVVDKKKRAPR